MFGADGATAWNSASRRLGKAHRFEMHGKPYVTCACRGEVETFTAGTRGSATAVYWLARENLQLVS